jgi:hypothetical protein
MHGKNDPRRSLTIRQLRDGRAFIIWPPNALDNLKQGSFRRLLGRLDARVLVLADSVSRWRGGRIRAPQSDSLHRVSIVAGGVRARRVGRIATGRRHRFPPQLTWVRLQRVLQVVVAGLSMLGGRCREKWGFWCGNVLGCCIGLWLHVTFGGVCGVCRRPSSMSCSVRSDNMLARGMACFVVLLSRSGFWR